MLDVDALVFDVLGTLVDEPSGIAAGIRELDPGLDDATVAELVATWQAHVDERQQQMARGDADYAPSHVVDLEAAGKVAERVGLDDPEALARLAGAGHRLAPWPDSVAGLGRLGRRFPLIGLSNASRTSLLRLDAHAGLRWHQALSAELAGAYKPDPAVYRLAVDVAGVEPDRLLMVAAHAWDLRGAREVGLRTAYVARPVGDPPGPEDRFDLEVPDLAALAEALGA